LFSHVEEGAYRYTGLKMCLGEDLLTEIQNCKVFMIGAGAIGCELLKNYAMLGLGTGYGGIIVTDPDVIEVSNLNRQFLFREKHLRKPKSQTAAAAAIQMNPKLKNKIEARLDKIHDGTSHIYNEQFFCDQTIVTNALDNV
jgi:molybdopterin/thiamine biosynthesis adenylyltransferase